MLGVRILFMSGVWGGDLEGGVCSTATTTSYSDPHAEPRGSRAKSTDGAVLFADPCLRV